MKKITKLFNLIFTSCFLCFTTGFDWTFRQCKEIVVFLYERSKFIGTIGSI